MAADLSCVGCKGNFTIIKEVDFQVQPPVEGDVLVCAGCGTYNVVTLDIVTHPGGCRHMTRDELANLDEEETKDMDFVKRSLLKGKQHTNGQI
jgi:hypothetical protein